MQFSDGFLHKKYNKHGKLKSNNPRSELLDFYDFKKMLIEIGIIGKIKNTTDIYAYADFEYAQPGRLSISVDEELCLHPIFSGEFESKINRGKGLVIYPQKDWFENDTGRNLRAGL